MEIKHDDTYMISFKMEIKHDDTYMINNNEFPEYNI